MANGVTLHIIRHEKTRANIERKYIGWTDEPIATTVRAKVPLHVNEVYGSDLLRCRETAKCYFPQATFIQNKNLRELHFGDFEMRTYEQLQHNNIYRAWIDDPLHTTIPNGESFLQFQQRVLEGIHDIVQQEKEYTLIVHGGVIRILLAKYGIEEQTFQQTIANHRTIYTLSWNSIEDFKGGLRCSLYSEAHITVNEHM